MGKNKEKIVINVLGENVELSKKTYTANDIATMYNITSKRLRVYLRRNFGYANVNRRWFFDVNDMENVTAKLNESFKTTNINANE